MVVRINVARQAWPKKFDARLRESPSAQESLRILLSHGLDRPVLVDFLGWYTNASLQSLRTWAGAMARKLSRVQSLSRKLADELDEGVPDFQMGGLTAWQISKEFVAIESLRRVSESTDDLGKHYKEISNSKGKGMNEEILVHLCLQVEAQTGSSHWSDIAYLLEVAFAAQGKMEHWDPDRLRNIVARFKKSCPKVYRGMRSFIFEQHSSRPKPFSAIRRSTRNRRTRTRPWEPTVHGNLFPAGRN